MESSKVFGNDLPFASWPWRVCNQAAVFQLVSSLSRESHEAMLAIYVTKELELLAIDIVGKGSISQVEVSFRDILGRASQLRAGGFFLIHNHPSGDPQPSQADIQFTRRMRRVSNDIDLPLLDHFVVSGSRMERVDPWI